jgi:type II secretory pathway pseudopilin PulG
MQQCNNATMQQCNNATMQQCNNATMQQCVKSKSKSFTLIEIVFTISIIGILLAILLPAMSAIKLNAQKVKDQSNLRKIAEAWKTFYVEKGIGHIGSGDCTALDMVASYAGTWWKDGPVLINDPHVYVSSADRYASPVLGESVLGDFPGGFQGTAFKAVNNFLTDGESVVFSYCLIDRIEISVPLETTPIAFTRGLKENGLWDEKAGLYGAKGGFVVFGDGHISWFDGSKPAKFLKWDGSGYTNNIVEALPAAGYGFDGAYIGAGFYLPSDLESEQDGSRILLNVNYT